MDDRTLLELAARAAGYKYEFKPCGEKEALSIMTNGCWTLWSPDLKAAVAAAIEERDAAWSALKKPIPMRPDDRLVIVGEKGERVTGSTWQSAWKRMLKMAIAAEVVTKEERFGLHDMKRRSITDTKGGRAAKLDGGGHVDERMLNTYDFEVPDSDAAGT